MKKADEEAGTHEETEIASHVRTNRDKVFFPGPALVDERTQGEIDEAVDAETERQEAIQSGEFEDEGDLGDTRTSKTTRASKASSKKGAKKGK